MRRAGGLWEIFLEPENFRWAFWRAARGKWHSPDVQRMSACLDDALHEMIEAVRSHRFPLGIYRRFKVFDPKERTIHAASFPERVLHHAIMNVCGPVFERRAIDDSYACRRGKGQYAALDRAVTYARHFRCYLKVDVRKYFDSVSHDVLKILLHRAFKDARMLELFEHVIDGYATTSGRGLPIGSLTSQHFANFYLGPLDRWAKETLRCPGYVRYMDDFVFWDHSLARLRQLRAETGAFLEEVLKLEWKPDPFIASTRGGMDFLGYRVYPSGLRMNRRSRRRFARRLRGYLDEHEAGRWTERQLHDHVLPLVAFTQKAAATEFRRRTLERLGMMATRSEPGDPRRLVEQHRQELPVGEPQQEPPGQPEQQPGVPAPPSSGRGWMATRED